MPINKLKDHLHLHFIVFIWGFTAILVALIPLDAIPLAWLRVFIASVTIFIFTRIKRISLQTNRSALFRLFFGGIIIALHWVTFFHAIKISTISITLVTMSSSAIFVAFLEPLLSKKKFQYYKLILASIAILGFIIIFRVESVYAKGIFYALISSVLLAFFSIFNSKMIKRYPAVQIGFYELFSAFIFLGIVLLISDSFTIDQVFHLKSNEWFFLIVLSTICTAYPFVAATRLLEKMGPFTMVLTNNLEPVYGVILAIIIFGEKEKMSSQFYIGAVLILCSVLLDSLIKAKRNKIN